MNKRENDFTVTFMDSIEDYEEEMNDCHGGGWFASVKKDALISEVEDTVLENLFDDCSNVIDDGFYDKVKLVVKEKGKNEYIEDTLIRLLHEYNIEICDEHIKFKFNRKSPIHNLIVDEVSRDKEGSLIDLICTMITTTKSLFRSILDDQDDYSKIVDWERMLSEHDVVEELKEDGIEEEHIVMDLLDYFDWEENECAERYHKCLKTMVNEQFRALFS